MHVLTVERLRLSWDGACQEALVHVDVARVHLRRQHGTRLRRRPRQQQHHRPAMQTNHVSSRLQRRSPSGQLTVCNQTVLLHKCALGTEETG